MWRGRSFAPSSAPPLMVDTKGDDSPVTLADRAAEAAIRAFLRERFPDHGVLGEEGGAEKPEAEFRGLSIRWTAPAPSSPGGRCSAPSSACCTTGGPSLASWTSR